jgi:hypothetical protein
MEEKTIFRWCFSWTQNYFNNKISNIITSSPYWIRSIYKGTPAESMICQQCSIVCFETFWLVDSCLSLRMLFKICCKAPYQEDIRFSYNFLDCVYATFNKGKVLATRTSLIWMCFGTSDHIFNIHDVQLIIIFISLTKIKDIVENLDELCF